MAEKYKDPYQAEDDARILMRHAEIKSDKKRHTAAKAHLKKQRGQIDNALANANPIAKGIAGGDKEQSKGRY